LTPRVPRGRDDDAADPLIGETFAGHYRIDARLGAGAIGVVYRARHTLFDRDFAVKVLASDLADDPEIRRRFVVEAKSLVAIEHPGVVRVRHFFEERGRLLLVMDLCEGESLARVLARDKKIAERPAVAIAVQVLEALDAVHWDGIVHRDLKPANIMISRDGDARGGAEVRAKILDFGLARIVGDRNAAHADTLPSTLGGIVGTVSYMSPEQIRAAGDVDLRSDLFAVGIILYEMLSGRAPFEGDTPLAAALAIVELPPAPLPATGPNGLSPALAAVPARALAKEREDRFQTAGEFADALRAALDGKSPAAPPRREPRATPTVRRGFLVAAAAAGAVVVAASVIAGATEGGRARGVERALRDTRSAAARLSQARASLELDPWAARDAARNLQSLPDSDASLDERSAAALLEGEAVRRIRSSAVVREADDLETLPDQAFARAYRFGAATPAEPAALARLGEELESEGRSKGACSILGLLRRAFPTSGQTARTAVALARAQVACARFDEARATLAQIAAEGATSPASAAVERLLDDVEQVREFDTTLADVLCVADLDGDGRAEIVGLDARQRLVAASLDGGATVVRATAELRGGEPRSACAFRPSPKARELLAVASGPATPQRAGVVETFEFENGAFVARGAPVPVRQDARLVAIDLFGDGRTELLVCHAGCAERSITLLEYDEKAGALVERPCALTLPSGTPAGAVDVFGAARLSDGRIALATGYPRLLGAALCAVAAGPVARLSVVSTQHDACVESVAPDGDGGAAYCVSHLECGRAELLRLQRDAHAPGLRRIRADGGDAPAYEALRELAVVGDGAVHAAGGARHYGIAVWRRDGRRRFVLTREFGGDEHPSGSILCVDDAPGAAPTWLRWLPWSASSRTSAFAADLDGDGRDDLALFDPATRRLSVLGVRDAALGGKPVEPLAVPEMHGGDLGGTRLPDAADNLALVGFNEEAVRAYEELIARSGEATLVADSLHEAVAGHAQLGRFERAHSLLDVYERREGGRGRANRARLLLWRALIWEAQGRPADALDCARESAASPDAAESDRRSAAGIVQRLEPFSPVPTSVEDAPSLRGAATLEAGARRVDVVTPTELPSGAFTLSCLVRFTNAKPGGGLAIGVQGDVGSTASSPLAAQTGVPFKGMFVSFPRISPPQVGLGVVAGGRTSDWSLATTPFAPLAPADALTWYRVEVTVLPFAEVSGVASVRMWRDGRDERLFERLTHFPTVAAGPCKVGAWLYREDDEPLETAGLGVEIRRLRITSYPPKAR